jgi:CRP-like cAMP-binding protein
VEGKVKYQNKIYKQGDIVGQDTLFSKENIEEIHCQEKTKLLKINKSNIIDAIEIYPEIGIEFFKV